MEDLYMNEPKKIIACEIKVVESESAKAALKEELEAPDRPIKDLFKDGRKTGLGS
jgi:hypothetical protein